MFHRMLLAGPGNMYECPPLASALFSKFLRLYTLAGWWGGILCTTSACHPCTTVEPRGNTANSCGQNESDSGLAPNTNFSGNRLRLYSNSECNLATGMIATSCKWEWTAGRGRPVSQRGATSDTEACTTSAAALGASSPKEIKIPRRAKGPARPGLRSSSHSLSLV